jgi:hypothetical protein
MARSLAEAYPDEQARCRELLKRHATIGQAGQFGYMVIKSIVAEADKAAAEQDVVAMLRAYEKMKTCK